MPNSPKKHAKRIRHRTAHQRLNKSSIAAAISAALDYPAVTAFGKQTCDAVIQAIQRIAQYCPQLAQPLRLLLPALLVFITFQLEVVEASPLDTRLRPASENTDATPPDTPWNMIIGSSAATLSILTASLGSFALKATGLLSEECPLNRLAQYGKNWWASAILINMVRDIIWAFFTSDTSYAPNIPRSIKRDLFVCGLTFAFGALLSGYTAWQGNPNDAKRRMRETLGAVLGLLAWDMPSYLSQWQMSDSIFPNSYGIAPLMGLCEGLAQMLCTAMPEWNRASISQFTIALCTLGFLPGTIWQMSAVSQSIPGLQENVSVSLSSVNLAVAVAAANALQPFAKPLSTSVYNKTAPFLSCLLNDPSSPDNQPLINE